jgi:hypothetical protein
MYVACLALAEFLMPSGNDAAFLADIEALLAEDELYERGFCRPLVKGS